MSYDLYLYAKSDAAAKRSELEAYLSECPLIQYESGQWGYGNEDTGVYFLFEEYDPAEDAEHLDPKLLEDFDPLGITFSINLIRPDFFGLETFQYLDKMLESIDVFVLNFQDDPITAPYRPARGALYNSWRKANISGRDVLPDDVKLFYYPEDRSSLLWKHNFTRSEMQEQLGENYFVPSALSVVLADQKTPAFVTTWTQHIPTVLPAVDYVILLREYRKFFRTVNEQGVVSYAKLMSALGDYFEDYGEDGSRIIHPENAEKIGHIFNSIVVDQDVEGFCGHLSVGLITNVPPKN